MTRTSGPNTAACTARPPTIACRAVTMPPTHARKVPSIHQIGRGHPVLPPPAGSPVHGYALQGPHTTIIPGPDTTGAASAMAPPPAQRAPSPAARHPAREDETYGAS